jgi:hypothetical protein
MTETAQISAMGEGSQLLARLHSFCFPGGEEAARRMRAVRTTQRGEMRMSPKARWIPFTSEEVTQATSSSFRWEARLDPGKLSTLRVSDAYDEGHGRLIVKAAGIVPIMNTAGPDVDVGELQRYLSSVAFCPSILLNHSSLEYTPIAPSTLRIRDLKGPSNATIDIEITKEGEPSICRAVRPRLVGKRSELTPWSGRCSEFREWEGLRVATRLEVCWHLPEGPFTYYRSVITSFAAVS